MNGYRHFTQPLFWLITYWLSMAAFLGVSRSGFARRGAEDSLRAHWASPPENALGLAPVAAVTFYRPVGSGAWFLLQHTRSNEYLANKGRTGHTGGLLGKEIQKIRASSSTQGLYFGRYAVDIFPEAASSAVVVSSSPEQVNRADPADSLTNAQQSVAGVSFDRPFHIVSSSPRNLYVVYALDQPLAPGQTMKMTFNMSQQTQDFPTATSALNSHTTEPFSIRDTFHPSVTVRTSTV